MPIRIETDFAKRYPRKRIAAAMEVLGYSLKDPTTKKKIDLVRGALEAVHDHNRMPGSKGKGVAAEPPTDAFFKNVAVLKIKFDFTNRDIARLVGLIPGKRNEVAEILSLRSKEIEWQLNRYATASESFRSLNNALQQMDSFDHTDLDRELGLRLMPDRDPTPSYHDLNIKEMRALEAARQRPDFQSGTPDGISILVEQYIDAGALEIAQLHLQKAMEEHPKHAGLWFQKARLLLALSVRSSREQRRYSLMSREADALSAAEVHWGGMEEEEATTGRNYREEVFSVCLKAYSLLPSNEAYEREAQRWSNDFGRLRELRLQVTRFLVAEAALRCGPLWEGGSEFEKRKLERLNVATAVRPLPSYKSKREKTSKRVKEPLFSAETDQAVLQSYDELIRNPLLFSKLQVRYAALAFIRLLRPSEYASEIQKFLSELKTAAPTVACAFFGPFDGSQVTMGPSERTMLHEHLDLVMTRNEQRELLRESYGRWKAQIDAQMVSAAASTYDDEIRICHARKDYLGAYEAACDAEKRGVYRRDDGHGALMLYRAAQWAALTSAKGPNKLIEKKAGDSHLSDKKLRLTAQQYFELYFGSSIDSLDYMPPDFFWGPNK